jgi:hypothetical protein
MRLRLQFLNPPMLPVRRGTARAALVARITRLAWVGSIDAPGDFRPAA